MSEKFNISHILKIDLDLKPRPHELALWESSRVVILSTVGYHVVSITKVHTRKGWHFWISILEELTDYEVALLQFLCGDDPRRTRLNFYREDYNSFGKFNILFSRKDQRELR